MGEDGGRRGPTNSLFNVFVPDDLVTFPLTLAPSLPVTEDNPAPAVTDTTSEINLETSNIHQGYMNAMPSPLNSSGSHQVSSGTYISLFNSKPDNQKDAFDSILSSPQQQAPPSIFVPTSIPESFEVTPSVPTLATGNTTQLWGNPSPTLYSVPAFTTPANTQEQHTGPAPVPSYFYPTSNSEPLSEACANNNLGQQDKLSGVLYADPRLELPQIPSGGKSNSFRLSNQKPVYAQYPGLVSPSAATQYNGTQGAVTSPPANTQNWGNVEYGSAISGMTQSPVPLVYTPTPTHATYAHISGSEDMGYSFGPVPPPVHDPLEPPVYKAVAYHWFYRKDAELWKPFSLIDSLALEKAHGSNSHVAVPVEGGRFDVDVEKRLFSAVYWEDTEPTQVQRCSWFYKGPMDSHFIPYSEEFSAKLEEEYAHAMRTNVWDKRLELDDGEAVVFRSPTIIVHFCQKACMDEWGNLPENQLRPSVLKRGVDGVQISSGESAEIAHLVFLVHGIGSFCDFKFRTVVETVDDFRGLSAQLLQTHFKESTGRVEFLPVQWHKALHGDGGIDEKLKPITLKSIPKLRHFTNDTLLDILFYTSPVYCQTIMDTVGKEMNRMYSLFLQRNPSFNSMSVAVAGHSLGSLILFDLLAHQPEIVQSITQVKHASPDNLCTPDQAPTNVGLGLNSGIGDTSARMISYTVGTVGTGHPCINYPVLNFHPTAFFALGSPIAMFVTVRGLDNLGKDFHFPTCPAFFNIFHPFDPVAYRIESLIDPSLDLRPVLVPHHKGRKRFHLELKETMARVGADFKHKVLESIRLTWNTVSQLTSFTAPEEAESAISTDLHTEEDTSEGREEKAIRIGSLNGGRRIDYVLQEAPHQILNEYLFALSSHVCYWESDDTVLLIMNEILNQGLSPSPSPDPMSMNNTAWPAPDAPYGAPGTLQSHEQAPTQAQHAATNFQTIGPPPTQGFMYKN